MVMMLMGNYKIVCASAHPNVSAPQTRYDFFDTRAIAPKEKITWHVIKRGRKI